MGAQRTIRFPAGRVPEWSEVAAKLAEIGPPAVVRMIDDMPAFPDEVPEPGWQDLRVGLTGGMVTLKRTADGFACVTWGDRDPALSKAWDDLCWAAAAAGGGTISDPAGDLSPDQFRTAAG